MKKIIFLFVVIFILTNCTSTKVWNNYYPVIIGQNEKEINETIELHGNVQNNSDLNSYLDYISLFERKETTNKGIKFLEAEIIIEGEQKYKIKNQEKSSNLEILSQGIKINSDTFTIYIGKVLIKHKNIKTRVKLEEGVRVISDEAFIDNNILLSIDLPKSLICIGKRAFKNCVNLKEVNLPEYLENIEDEAFNKSKIKSIEIPKSVRNIGYAAFKDCEELDEVKLQDTPDTVGAAAFKTFIETSG